MIGMRADVDLSGFDDIDRNTQANKPRLVMELAQLTEARIKNTFSHTSPGPAGHPPGVDTGALKNSIVAEQDGDDAIVSDGVEYGVHLEYGTVKMAARPWARPAAVWLVYNLPRNVKKEYLGV